MTYGDLLRIRPFRDLWLGQAISQFGDAFYYVVFMFMAKRLTGSDSIVGLVGVLETLPHLLFGATAGVYADRFDRRRIMLLSDLACGAVLLLFAAVLLYDFTPPIEWVLPVPFLLSAIRVFFLPAKSAAIPNLVPKTALQSANSLSMTTQNLAPMIGLALSATVLSAMWETSPRWFFFTAVAVNAASFLLSAVFVARLPAVMPEPKETAPDGWGEFKDGLRYLRSRRELVTLLVLMTGFRLTVAPFFVAYMASNDAWYGGKPGTLGWLEFAFFLGMIVASPLVGRVKIHRPGRWFATGLMVVGGMVLLMAFRPPLWLFFLYNLACGLAVPPADIPLGTYLQASVPNEYLGRVNAALNMVATGAMPIGLGLGGWVISKWGVTAGFVGMGVGMMLACLVGFLDPVFREARMPEETSHQEEIAAEEPRQLVGMA